MTKVARDVMTRDPACCSPSTTLDQVAKLMVQNNCGEIPIVESSGQPIGVVTDRDIVCRIAAEGKNPIGHTAESCMSSPVVTVLADAPFDDVLLMMEGHQIRRVLVVDDGGCCAGIISQADIASVGPRHKRPSCSVNFLAIQTARRSEIIAIADSQGWRRDLPGQRAGCSSACPG
jgi:CBS domain-containing protein